MDSLVRGVRKERERFRQIQKIIYADRQMLQWYYQMHLSGCAESVFKEMKKQKIVLINPTNPDSPPNYFGPPYGLSLIGACLLEDDREVAAYDFDLQPLSVMLSSIGEIILADNPRYIGIAIQSCTRGPVYELIKAIRKIDKSITIILGGPFASLKYDLLLKNFPVDYVVIGDGERTLVDLLNCLEEGGDLNEVNGIAFMDNGHLCRTKKRLNQKNLDLLPFPAFHLFKDFDKKINLVQKERMDMPNFILGRRCTTLKNALLLLASRGCIYNCNFCPMSGVLKDKIRFHSPEYFVDMVEYFYRKYKIKNYIFGDNTFTLVRERVIKICDEICRRKFQINWGCMTRSDYVDLALLKKMRRAGCFEISYGVESGSAEIQKTIRKNLNLTITKKAFQWTKKAGIRSILMLTVGNLGESNLTIRETLSYIKDLEPASVLVKIVKVYPGTEIHRLFEKQGLLKKNYYLTDDFHPPTFSLQHSEDQIKKFHGMINTRRTFIQIANACNNNCIFCLLDRKVKLKGLSEIKKELMLASVRGEHIVLFGGEPFLRKDIFEILDYAFKIDIHHLHIYSNARVFFYKDLIQKVGQTQLQKMIIPFFGESSIHDRIACVPHAFLQTIEGIKNLKRLASNLQLQAWVFISKANYKKLFSLVHILYAAGIDEFNFIFFKDSVGLVKADIEDIPSMSLVVSGLKKVADFLKQTKRRFSLEGFVPCVLKTLKENLVEPYYPFNEVITLSNKLINCLRAREKEKEKFSFCIKCKENDLCEGVWKEYAKVYGKREFKPC